MAKILFTHEGDSVSYEKTSMVYTIRYEGDNGQINEVTWHAPDNILAQVKANYQYKNDGTIEYKYTLEVDKESPQPLKSFAFFGLSIIDTSQLIPENWRGIIRPSYEDNDPTTRVSWYSSYNSIQKGNSAEGYQVSSMALPVYSQAFTKGPRSTLSYIDYGPNIQTQYYFDKEVHAKHGKGKRINTGIPLIRLSTPFDPTETYTAFHEYLIEYIEKGFIETSIATSLTDTSAAVLAALTANDVKNALSNLKAVNKLVEGEDGDHENKKGQADDEIGKPKPLIVKELRKILKFNLNFIMKQLKSE